MRGGDRKSKSDEEHKKAGTFRNDRHGNRLSAQPISGTPAPPQHFDSDHVAKWNEVCGWLIKFEIMAEQDYDSIKVYVETELVQRKAWDQLNKLGHTIETKTGPKLNPAWRVYSECDKILKPLREKFGFSPRDRQGIRIGKPEKKKSDPILAMLKPSKVKT